MFTVFILAAIFILVCFSSNSLSQRNRETTTAKDRVMVGRIDGLLPQTQCGKCHFDGCKPYAEAIARGQADINRCPPGGYETVLRLAELLGRDARHISYPFPTLETAMLAEIDEQNCIGCVKCIRACPVDAIIGAPKSMHTVIDPLCTGCELCLPSCPVDCIELVPRQLGIKKWVWNKPQSTTEILQ